MGGEQFAFVEAFVSDRLQNQANATQAVFSNFSSDLWQLEICGYLRGGKENENGNVVLRGQMSSVCCWIATTEPVNSTPFYHKWKETGISRPYFIWPVLDGSFKIHCLRNVFFTIASEVSPDEDTYTVAVQIWTAETQLGAEGLSVWWCSRLGC